VQAGETIFSSEETVYAAIALPPDLPPDIYTTVYKNVSTVDGHAWTGSFTFVVLEPDGSVPDVTPFAVEGGGTAQGYLPGIGDTTLRWFGMIAAVAMVGATVFYLFVSRPSADFLRDEETRQVEDSTVTLAADLVLIAIPVIVLSLAGQLFLLADRLGGPDEVTNILFETRTGDLWLARLGVCVALTLLFLPALLSHSYRTGARATMLMAGGALGGLGLLITYSMGSHAATGGGEFWSVGADFVHYVATAAWLGALIQLPLLFWWTRRLGEPKRLLYMANVFDRFAWLAVISVAVLIASGTFNGFVALPTLESLWETTYGRVLMAKLALILPMLGVAGINAVFLAPALSDAIDALYADDPEARPREVEEGRFARQLSRLQSVLPTTILLELALGAAVLVSVAVLTQTTTAEGELRGEASRPGGEFRDSRQAGNLDIDLGIEPFGLGQSTFQVAIAPLAGGAPDVLDVRLRAFYDDPDAPPSAGAGATTQELEATADPRVWQAESALLTRPGDWRIEVRVRQRGADDVVSLFPVQQVGGVLATQEQPEGLFDLPFTSAEWNWVAGAAIVALGAGAFVVWQKRPPEWERATSMSVLLASGVAIAAGVALIVGVRPPEVVPDDSPVEATQASVAAGRSMFEMNCVACHGQTGKGDGPLAESLDVQPADLGQHVPFHSDGTLFGWISQGIPKNAEDKNMPAFEGQFSEEERWHLVNFLRAEFGLESTSARVPAD
jgi:putative copper export protein/mono/diheme cytochrome c family protein